MLSFRQVVQYDPAARNSPETKQKRLLWALCLAEDIRQGFEPVYLDEIGHTLWTRPRRARSRRGYRAVNKV